MVKYLKDINQSNKTVKYTFLTINIWQTGVLDTELQARRQDSRGRGLPSRPPVLPTSGSDSLCALRNLLLKQEHPQLSNRSSGHPLLPQKQLNLDHLLGWEMGLRKEACTGTGNRDARGSGTQSMAWRGRGSMWPHPLVLSGCLHLGEVQPQDNLTRASKPALLKLYCEQDSPGTWRF